MLHQVIEVLQVLWLKLFLIIVHMGAVDLRFGTLTK